MHALRVAAANFRLTRRMCLAAAAACADVDKVTALVCCDARFSILVGSDAPLSPFNWLRLGLKKKLRFRSSSGRRSARTTTAEETSSSRRQRTRSCLQNCGSGAAAAGGARARQLQKRRRAAGGSERGAVFRVAGAERARLRFGVVWCNACAAIAAAAEVDGISGGNAGA
jgi:hypothetical protein